jgi:hypothetical protein
MRFNEYPLSPKAGRSPISATFCSQDRYVTVLDRKNNPVVYSLATGNPQRNLTDAPCCWIDYRRLPPTSGEQRYDSTEVALVVADRGLVRRFNVDRQTVEPTIYMHGVCRCTYSLSGSLLATGGKRGQVVIWRLESESGEALDEPQRVAEFELALKPVVSMAFNSTNLLLYVVLASGEVRMINLHDESDVAITPPDNAWADFHCMAVHAHPHKPSFVAFGGLGSTVWIGQHFGTLFPVETAAGAYIRGLRVTSDQTLAVVGQNGVFQVSLQNNAVGAYYLRKPKSLVLGGSLSRKGYGNVAFVAAPPEPEL